MLLLVIICSTRPGRIGHQVANWFGSSATVQGPFEIEIVDLKKIALPLFDEPLHPRLGKYSHDHTLRWSECVSRADALIFVTPEYNYAPPPTFVNALCFLSKEWNYKPVGFVSYGGISGGLRAVQIAKHMVTTLRMLPTLEGVVIPNVTSQLDERGAFVPTPAQEAAIPPMLQELQKLAAATQSLRPISDMSER